jgi:hypothetical protein
MVPMLTSSLPTRYTGEERLGRSTFLVCCFPASLADSGWAVCVNVVLIINCERVSRLFELLCVGLRKPAPVDRLRGMNNPSTLMRERTVALPTAGACGDGCRFEALMHALCR